MSLQSYLHAVPKAELHVHLEGTIQPETLLRLAQRNAVPLPADTAAGLREWFRFTDFHHFVQVYVTITRCLRTAADYELIVLELAAEMARQNQRYAEVTFSPSTHRLSMGLPEETFLTGLASGRRRAQDDYGVRISWIFDIVRDSLDPATYYEYVTDVAIRQQAAGVVAIGLAGLERDSGPEPYVRFFDRARDAGLHCIPHAGELTGPPTVWGALTTLRAERIGHGVRSVEDEALVRELARRRIPLEVCPTSNVLLNVYPDVASHPLRRLHDAGVPVTVNSDDPALFNTTLTGELELLATSFGFTEASVDEVDAILLNAVRYSFQPESQKQQMLREFQTEIARLRSVHL
jgi:aminodeoxyfutalosine deaminase